MFETFKKLCTIKGKQKENLDMYLAYKSNWLERWEKDNECFVRRVN